jgi:hypothetical protein
MYSIEGIDQEFITNRSLKDIVFTCGISLETKLEDAELWYVFYAMPSDVKNHKHILQGLLDTFVTEAELHAAIGKCTIRQSESVPP